MHLLTFFSRFIYWNLKKHPLKLSIIILLLSIAGYTGYNFIQIKGFRGKNDLVAALRINESDRILINKIAFITKRENLTDSGTYYLLKISNKRVKEYYNICNADATIKSFFRHPVIDGAYSGFAINNNTIVTAGHIIKYASASELRVVYGYCFLDINSFEIRIKKEDVFLVDSITTNYRQTITSSDYAALHINNSKTIPSYRIVSINASDNVTDKRLYMAGYSLGMPLTYDNTATLIKQKEKPLVYTVNGDSFKGNSGGPLFYLEDNQMFVIGIVVRSNPDTIYNEISKCNNINIDQDFDMKIPFVSVVKINNILNI